MTGRRDTRREYLQRVGALGVTGLLPDTNTPPAAEHLHEDVSAAELLIPESAAPVGFETTVESTAGPLVRQLRTADACFEDADTAGRGFWTGRDEDNPRWVLSCLALVCDWPIARQTVETVGSAVHDEFVAEYDTETPAHIDFEQSRTQRATLTDWRADMIRPEPFSDSSSSSEVLFTDMLRLRYHENVLLGTVVFGPATSEHDVETMRNRYSRLQHTRLRNQTES
jgi:hypothetical protein